MDYIQSDSQLVVHCINGKIGMSKDIMNLVEDLSVYYILLVKGD